MKKAIFSAALLICFAVVCTAADLTSVSGRYISKRDGKEFITLYPDGTFALRQRKVPVNLDNPFDELTGKFELNGEEITLILSDGAAGTCKIKDNILEDGQGTKWIKEGSEKPREVGREKQKRLRF